jgi:hypothetical protein
MSSPFKLRGGTYVLQPKGTSLEEMTRLMCPLIISPMENKKRFEKRWLSVTQHGVDLSAITHNVLLQQLKFYSPNELHPYKGEKGCNYLRSRVE